MPPKNKRLRDSSPSHDGPATRQRTRRETPGQAIAEPEPVFPQVAGPLVGMDAVMLDEAGHLGIQGELHRDSSLAAAKL